MSDTDPSDPYDSAGLVREAYRIDGIGPAECRSIFLDWALRLPAGTDEHAALAELLRRHGEPGHPMTAVLEDALAAPAPTGRRGGAMGRRRTLSDPA